MRPFYRESGRNESRMSRVGGVWQPRARATMLARYPNSGPGIAFRMNQSLLRLLGFVVLAAIVLATGFGALGAPLTVPGGF